MDDAERLNLLKEIAGTRVYDERRAESLKIMEDTDRRTDDIRSVLSTIDSRLQELEGEQKELKEYQVLDKERRRLEYTLYSQELAAATAQLTKVEGRRLEASQKAQEAMDSVRKVQEDREAIDQKVGFSSSLELLFLASYPLRFHSSLSSFFSSPFPLERKS